MAQDNGTADNKLFAKPVIRWLLLIIAALAVCMALMIATVYYTDPFMHYRTPNSYIYYDARYCLAGLLKNEKYDTVIIGSSMMQNTDPSVLEAAGWKAIKATCSGACPSDIELLANYSLKNGKPGRMIIAIDCFTFIYPPDYARTEMPAYLYDDNIWNDGKYWFNNKIWMDLFPRALLDRDQLKPNPVDLSSIDDWASKYTFSRETVLSTVKNVNYDEKSPAPSNLKQMISTYNATVFDIASAHPDVEFYLLFPPYSILSWYGSRNEGMLQDGNAFKEYIVEHTLANIRIFDFQDLGEIITNLDNYKDNTHYSPEINTYMMKCIMSGENEVTTVAEQKAKNENLMTITKSWKLIR